MFGRSPYRVGDYFTVPLVPQGIEAFGQVLSVERQALNSVGCAFWSTHFVEGAPVAEPPVAVLLVTPDLLISLKSIKGLDQVKAAPGGGVTIGGLMTLDAISRDAQLRRLYPVLAEAAESVATPQIRNAATLAGNVCQRPWCWYYRNGFACLKNGGTTCYSITGENTFHAIFGGGPSYIVHPSDTAPALVALDATFRLVGPDGERTLPAGEFFTLPTVDASLDNA